MIIVFILIVEYVLHKLIQKFASIGKGVISNIIVTKKKIKKSSSFISMREVKHSLRFIFNKTILFKTI